MEAFRWLMIVVICLALAAPACAVSGYVGMDYDFMSQAWVWGVGLERGLGEYLAVGTALEAVCPGYGYKGPIPSWMPEMQRYEVWAEARWRDVSVRITDWCDHYLAQSGVNGNDTHGLTLRVRYGF